MRVGRSLAADRADLLVAQAARRSRRRSRRAGAPSRPRRSRSSRRGSSGPSGRAARCRPPSCPRRARPRAARSRARGAGPTRPAWRPARERRLGSPSGLGTSGARAGRSRWGVLRVPRSAPRSGSIQAMIRDKRPDRIRDEVPDRASGGDSRPDRRRRHGQQRTLDERDAVAAAGESGLDPGAVERAGAGPRDDRKARELEHPLGRAPARQAPERLRREHEPRRRRRHARRRPRACRRCRSAPPRSSSSRSIENAGLPAIASSTIVGALLRRARGARSGDAGPQPG